MFWFTRAVAVLAALGIIWIGLMYLFRPRAIAPGFGLPLPGQGAETTWWLRLKGSRDVVSGLVVLAMLIWGTPRLLGLLLLIEALIPIADMSVILAARGSVRAALWIHGLTAVFMIAAALPLLSGLA